MMGVPMTTAERREAEAAERRREHLGKGYIGVDLDGTLAEWTEWCKWSQIGVPIPEMVERVQGWLAEGHEVVVFTARLHEPDLEEVCLTTGERYTSDMMCSVIGDWTEEHVGTRLRATNIKHWKMFEFWDDRCVQVVTNTGLTLAEADVCDQSELLATEGAP